MAAFRYDDAVIGSVVDLRFTVRDRSSSALVDLESVGASATCTIQSPKGTVVVDAGACVFSGTQGRYVFATSGRAPGLHKLQFAIYGVPNHASPLIEPVEPAEINLVRGLITAAPVAQDDSFAIVVV